MRLAFVGPMGSGKSTASDYMVASKGFVRVSLAKPVKDVARVLTEQGDTPERDEALLRWATDLLPDPVYRWGLLGEQSLRDRLVYSWKLDARTASSYRELCQKVGTDSGRAINDLIWINYMRRFLPDGNVTIDDLRFLNEYAALKDLGFVVVRLEISEDVRRRRLSERDGSFDPSTQGHASETELASIPHDHVISNNEDDVRALYRQLDQFYAALTGEDAVPEADSPEVPPDAVETVA
ncbi:MAG: hypothetical protein M3P49_13390 [Actinomycetota bacterium]|nr:hypothetical protein [Actinomycetota bacterium]